MSVSAFQFTADTQPGPLGFAEEIKLPGDAWAGVTQRCYAPYVFDMTSEGIAEVFPLSNGWLCVDPFSSAEIYVAFEDRSGQPITAPMCLSYGLTVQHNAAQMRVVGVRRSGHMRILHGPGSQPLIPTGQGQPSESRTITLNFSGVSTWLTYQSPDGDPAYGVVRVAPVECGISGSSSNNRLLAPNPAGFNAAHYEFLFYGAATLRQDLSLAGTVTGGIYVSEFTSIITVVANGSTSNAAVSNTLTASMFWAVYYKLTAAGVTAGAVPPDRKMSAPYSRLYNRSQTPYNIA